MSSGSVERLEVDHLQVAALAEIVCLVEHERTPPLIPAAKLRPVGPMTTTTPPVMYSQQWSPVPSTTAEHPLLRTQNRSPARPRKKARPPVAP